MPAAIKTRIRSMHKRRHAAAACKPGQACAAGAGGRVSVLAAPMVGPLQYLPIKGTLEFKEGEVSVTSMEDAGMIDLSGMRMFVVAWAHRDHMTSCEVGRDHTFELRLPLADQMPRVTQVMVGAYMLDPESEESKFFPIDQGGLMTARLLGARGLSERAEPRRTQVKLGDPFSANQMVLTLEACGEVHVTLRESALEYLPAFNEGIKALSADIASTAEREQCRIPTEGEPFMQGMTAMSCSGVDELKTGPVAMHYGVLGHFLKSMPRRVSVPVLAHYLEHTVFQSGKPLEEIQAWADPDFVSCGCAALWGITSFADGCTYQADRAVHVEMDAADSQVRLGVHLQTSENIGLPLAETGMLGRPRPAPVVQAIGTGGVLAASASGARCTDVPSLHRVADSTPRRNVRLTLEEDDCETSTTAGMMAAYTVRQIDWGQAHIGGELGLAPAPLSPAEQWVANELGQCHSTSKMDPGSVRAMCRFYGRLRQLMESGDLDIQTVVGMACSASAGDSVHSDAAVDTDRDPQGAYGSGHCWAAYRLRCKPATGAALGLKASRKAGPAVKVEMLEGTTHMKRVKVTAATPRYQVRILQGEAYTTEELTLDKLLTALAHSAAAMTSISDRLVGELVRLVRADTRCAQVGEGASSFGWSCKEPLEGYMRATHVMNHLDCLALAPEGSKELDFYRWIMYCGWRCGSQGLGCLPVNEEGGAKTTGCRPKHLHNTNLRGVPAELPAELSAIGAAILDEIMPPSVSKQTLHEFVLDHYHPVQSLLGLNMDHAENLEEGAPHETVCCMESPKDPSMRNLYYLAKSTLVDKANLINEALPDSDGIRGDVGVFGNTVTVRLTVPVQWGPEGKPRRVSYIQSLRAAALELKWPGADRWK